MSPGLLEDGSKVVVLPGSLGFLMPGLHLRGKLVLHSKNGLIHGLDICKKRLKSRLQELGDLRSVGFDMLLELRPAGSFWLTRCAVVAPNAPLPRHVRHQRNVITLPPGS